MSHFAVLVIGDDVEAQLQPYHEYECTGIEDQYVINVDITNEARSIHTEHYATEPFPKFVADYYGLDVRDDGSVWRKTNPNAKWDWWVVGGRWSGFFSVKPNPKVPGSSNPDTRIDAGPKGLINIEGMRLSAAQEAIERWKTVEHLVSGLPEPRLWDEVFPNGHQIPDFDELKAWYYAQPAIKAVHEWLKQRGSFFIGWHDIEPYLQRESDAMEQYVALKRNQACIPYAVVMEGKWSAKGKMGFFGVSNDIEDPAKWYQQMNDILDRIPDDTLLTIVDCHI